MYNLSNKVLLIIKKQYSRYSTIVLTQQMSCRNSSHLWQTTISCSTSPVQIMQMKNEQHLKNTCNENVCVKCKFWYRGWHRIERNMRFGELQCFCNMMRQTSEVSPQWQLKVVLAGSEKSLLDFIWYRKEVERWYWCDFGEECDVVADKRKWTDAYHTPRKQNNS